MCRALYSGPLCYLYLANFKIHSVKVAADVNIGPGRKVKNIIFSYFSINSRLNVYISIRFRSVYA